jgi:hypothetical protein
MYSCSSERSLFLGMPSNVAAEWLSLLFRVRMVLGSNFIPETSYSEFLHGFLQSFDADSGIVP